MMINFVSLTFVGYMLVLTCIVLFFGYELLVVHESQTNSLVPVDRAAEAGSVSTQDNSSKTPAENRTVQVLKFYLYS